MTMFDDFVTVPTVGVSLALAAVFATVIVIFMTRYAWDRLFVQLPKIQGQREF